MTANKDRLNQFRFTELIKECIDYMSITEVWFGRNIEFLRQFQSFFIGMNLIEIDTSFFFDEIGHVGSSKFRTDIDISTVEMNFCSSSNFQG